MTLDAYIEAILFWKGEPMNIHSLGTLLEKTDEEITQALTVLENKISDRGLKLIFLDETVMLGTNPGSSQLIEKITKEELSKDISKAGLETLTIILYRGPVARRDIDYIRGVNSNFIIRNLLVRGLIEKTNNPKDQRSFLYKPSIDLFRYLGISRVEDLPEFDTIKKALEQHSLPETENTTLGVKNDSYEVKENTETT